MSVINLSPQNSVLTINGATVDEWGQTDPPLTLEQIDDKEVLVRGLSGGAARIRRINEGWSLTVNLQPGSENSKYLSTLANNAVGVSASYATIGTNENWIGTEGVMTRQPSMGRGGPGFTDDQFQFQFNAGSLTTGGSS
jgi:hypothetical protein